MNEKVREEIERLTKRHPFRQYAANRDQAAKLAELGLTALMPRRFLGSSTYGVGNLDAKVVIAAAEDAGKYAGGFVNGEGDVVKTDASALYRALHSLPEPDPALEVTPEVTPEPSPEITPEPAPESDVENEDEQIVELDGFMFDDVSYGVRRIHDGNRIRYEVDAEWSDGPAAIFDHEPDEKEVYDVHSDYLEWHRQLDRIIALEAREAARDEARRRLEDAVLMAKEEALSYGGVRLLTVEEAADMKRCHPETVRRALRAGQLSSADKIGNVWLLDARTVASWEPRSVGRPSQDQFVEDLIAAIEAANGGVFPAVFEVLFVEEGEWVTFNTHSLTGDNFAREVAPEGRKSNFRYNVGRRGPLFTRRLLVSSNFPPVEGVEIGGFDYWVARCFEATVGGAEAALLSNHFIASLADIRREGNEIVIAPRSPECPPIVVQRTRWEWVAWPHRFVTVSDLINFVIDRLDDCGVRAAELAAVRAALEGKYGEGEVEQEGDALVVSTPEGRKTFRRRAASDILRGWNVTWYEYVLFVPGEEILTYIKNL